MRFALAFLFAAAALAESLDDIHILRTYRAGKNSFVESTDRHAGMWTGKGFRYTLLDLKGVGSLRHIWSTWLPDGPYFEWQFFIDGESTPSIRGALPDIVNAAARLTACPAPACSVAMDPAKRDFNLYAPIPFDKSLRIDVVQQTEKVGLFFAQLDYRTEDESLRGARLTQHNGTLAYRNWHPHPVAPPQIETAVSQSREIRPGERALVASAEGPAIVRAIELQGPIDGDTWLHIRYDNQREPAFSGPLSRIIGDFAGASFRRLAPTRARITLPMPVRTHFAAYIENQGAQPIHVSASLNIERAGQFSENWGYLHGYYYKNPGTNGHRLHQILYTRGRGHWLGMSLFHTGHDHGGGDFAVIDGESPAPSFLHGVNGEDYFTFAWFGKGRHQPYAQAFTNDQGRYRHHFENPYPFRHSFHMEWGAYPNLQPESFTVWYQDTPNSTILQPSQVTDSWDVIGQVPIPLQTTQAKKNVFSVLPSIADLDAGRRFPLSNEGERFEAGWLNDLANGPSLNLTYISRHGVKVAGEKNLGGNGHAFLARKRFLSPRAEQRTIHLSHDDPIEIECNGKVVYRELNQFSHFETRSIALPLAAGNNEIIVRLTNYFNRTFNWTGFSVFPLP